MSNVYTGSIKWIGPLEQPTDKFQKRDFVIKTEGEYPKDICFQLINKGVDKLDHFSVGQTIEVHFDLQSKEYNGKWYTNATAWKIEKNSYNNLNAGDFADGDSDDYTGHQNDPFNPF
jgi:hypothetical protein